MEFDKYEEYFNDHLGEILKKNKISYAELGRYLGVTRATVSNWARKKVKINRLITIGLLHFFEKEKNIIFIGI